MQARLIVPTADNAGIDFPTTTLNGIRQRLIDLCGGYTEAAGFGGYRGEGGRVYRDAIAIFDLDYTDTEILLEIIQFARTLCDQLAQEAIYLRIGVEAHFVKR